MILLVNGKIIRVRDLKKKKKKGDFLNKCVIVKCFIEQNSGYNEVFHPYMCRINGIF